MKKRKHSVLILCLLIILALCGCSKTIEGIISNQFEFLDTPKTEIILPGEFTGFEALFNDAVNDVFGSGTTGNYSPDLSVPTTTASNEAPSQPQNTSSPSRDSSFLIHFIDVGQADAALIICDGEAMLIDGGNRADSDIIYSVLTKYSIDHLKIVVATHGHEDHCGGIPGAFHAATASITICPVTQYDSKAFENFAKYAEEKGGGITVPNVGDKFSLGSSSVVIVGVNADDEDPNNTSIVLKIDYGNQSFLFTGDAEREAEQAILDSGIDIASTVLKVAHHGSSSSSIYPFLREVMPQYAVISVGKDNEYGHPHENVMSRLSDADVTVFRTDLQGDIICRAKQIGSDTVLEWETENSPVATRQS